MTSARALPSPLTAFDPIARHEAERELGDKLSFRDTLDEAIADAEAILIMTAWPEFKALPEMISKLPGAPLLVDGRRMIEKDSVPNYAGIGLQ